MRQFYILTKINLLLILCFLAQQVLAQQTIYQHNFGTTFFGATANYTIAPIDYSQAIIPTTSSWTSNSGSVTSSTNSASGRALRVANSSGTKTLTLSFEVSSGYEIDITSFNFWRKRDSSGAQNWSMTINGINVGSGTVPISGANIGQTLVLNPVNGLSGTVTMVLTLTGASGSGGFNLDNFILFGNSNNLNPSAIINVFDNNIQSANNVNIGEDDILLGSYVFEISQSNARLEEFVAQISGSYEASDLNNIKLWISNNNVFNVNTATLIGENSGNGNGFEVFSLDELLLQDNTYYFYITVSTSCLVNENVTIRLDASSEDYFAFASVTPVETLNVNTSANGTKTILGEVIKNVTMLEVNELTPSSFKVNWVNPTNCYDEIIIVAHTSNINSAPTGTYSASSLSYTDSNNPNYPGGGKVLYNGISAPQTITDLDPEQLYFLKVFVRNGLNWSTGASTNIGGIVWNGSAWSNVTGPTASDNVLIQGNLTLSSNLSLNNLTLQTGVLNLNANQLSVGGDIISIGGTISATDGSIVFNGSTPQIIGENVFSSNMVNNLIIENSTMVTLAGTTRLINLLSVNQGTFNTDGFLVCESTSIVGPVLGEIIGNVIVERFIPARRAFRFLSSPVTTENTIFKNWQESGSSDPGYGTHITGSSTGMNGFDTTTSGAASMFRFNNLINTWESIDNTDDTTLKAGDAYRIFIRGDRTINLANNNAIPNNTIIRTNGTLKTGPHTITDLSSVSGDFNLIGNPYQSPVNLQTLLSDATNIQTSFVMVWDPTRNTRGAYVTVNPIKNTNNFIGSSANRYLQAGQSCFVMTTGPSPTVTFQESHKYTVTTNQNIFRTEEEENPKNLRLTLYSTNAYNTNQSAADGVLVLFDEQFNNQIDFMDAPKISNIDEDFMVKNNNQSISIESKKLPLDQEEIQLSITKYRHAQYTMVLNIDSIDGTTAFLHDSFTNQYIMIAPGIDQVYNFSVDNTIPNSVSSERFKIVFQVQPLNSSDFELANIKVFPNPSSGDFFLSLPFNEKSAVKIKNLLGQTVYQQESNGQMNLQINASTFVTTGVYIIEVMIDSHAYSHKIIFN